ncbi:MAG: hypothetical protein AAFR21_03340 [Pseudomonadota bacterium]
MLTMDRVALPPPVEVRLKRTSEFVDNVMDFTRDDLIGFRRPIAATFAFSAPFVAMSAYQVGGLMVLAQVVVLYSLCAAAGIYLVGRNLWPQLVEEFEHRTIQKRRAIADLKCGFGEAGFINLQRAPFFFEHEHGVLVLADAGDFRTLFLSIENDDDPRWDLYQQGEMVRHIWRWMRLPVSRELVQFSTEASKFARPNEPMKIQSIEVWEAVNVALGEPLDGAVIHKPFPEVADQISRLL